MHRGDELALELTDQDGLAGETYDPEVAHRYLYGAAVDQILAVEDGSGDVLWGLGDHQGTIRDVIDSAGELDNHVQYDAFGRITGGAVSADFLFAFTGRPYDPETGLYDYRARWYDPDVGRFASEDPAGLAAGDVNLYRYCSNSPVINVDPSGLCFTGVMGALADALKTGATSLAQTMIQALETAMQDIREQVDPYWDPLTPSWDDLRAMKQQLSHPSEPAYPSSLFSLFSPEALGFTSPSDSSMETGSEGPDPGVRNGAPANLAESNGPTNVTVPEGLIGYRSLDEEYEALGGPSYTERAYRQLRLERVILGGKLHALVSDGRCDGFREVRRRCTMLANAAGYRSAALEEEPAFFQVAVEDLERNPVITTASMMTFAAEWTYSGLHGFAELFGAEEGDHGPGDVWLRMEIQRNRLLIGRLDWISRRIKDIRAARPDLVPR